MKKNLLFIFVLVSFQLNAQINFNYKSLYNLTKGAINNIVDFRGSKIVFYNYNVLERLDTINGVFSSFKIPSNSNNIQLIGVAKNRSIYFKTYDSVFVFNDTIWKKYQMPAQSSNYAVIDSGNVVHFFESATNVLYSLKKGNWTSKNISFSTSELYYFLMLGGKNELVLASRFNRVNSPTALYRLNGSNLSYIDSLKYRCYYFQFDTTGNIWHLNYNNINPITKRLLNHTDISYAGPTGQFIFNKLKNTFWIIDNSKAYYFDKIQWDTIPFNALAYYQGGDEIFEINSTKISKYNKILKQRDYSLLLPNPTNLKVNDIKNYNNDYWIDYLLPIIPIIQRVKTKCEYLVHF